jgi:hypothetical protein
MFLCVSPDLGLPDLAHNPASKYPAIVASVSHANRFAAFVSFAGIEEYISSSS